MPARTLRPLAVELHCPSCRTLRRCQPVGTATVAKRKREVVQCLTADCSLTWIPERSAVPARAPRAA